jgi:RNA polymerase sigma factor (sigma-70 family)
VGESETHSAIHAVWKIESARLIASLARIVRDVGRAEELAQDALVAALEIWPAAGIPDKPGAWLLTTAKHHAINHLRRSRMLERKHAQLGQEIETERQGASEELEALLDDRRGDDLGDDLLRLIFIACHPILPTQGRAALTLRLVGGLTTEEIARAFLVSEPTVAQRIVRAKRTLADAQIPFEVPRGEALGARLSSVLEVIYLIFNEGYSATAGDDLMRPALCEEALRLGRILAGLVPDESEVHGLVALMELHSARAATRVNASGEPILLLEQDRTRWDQLLMRRGFVALGQAEQLGGRWGRYTLQAAIAACHAHAVTAEQTDWGRIARLYQMLGQLTPSPVVELNRAVAVAMAEGPAAGLVLIDALADEPTLKGYHLLPAARGDLLVKLGRWAEARADFEQAASLTRNARQRELLLARAAACFGKS